MSAKGAGDEDEPPTPPGAVAASEDVLRLQADGIAATLAAAAAQLDTSRMSGSLEDITPTQEPEDEGAPDTPIEEEQGRPGPAGLERLDSPATPWVPEIGAEASALAASLAAHSRSATPASNAAPASPAVACGNPLMR